jgi:hypothetical protein
MNTDELRKAANAVYLACEEDVAKDLSNKLSSAALEIDRLTSMLHTIKGILDSNSINIDP